MDKLREYTGLGLDLLPRNSNPYLYCGAGAVLYAAYWSYSFRPRNFPPGPAAIPFVGTLYNEENQEEELVHLGEKYGPVFSVSKFGVRASIIVNDFDVYWNEIRPHFKTLIGRPQISINDLFDGNNGVVFSQGAYWTGKSSAQEFITVTHYL